MEQLLEMQGCGWGTNRRFEPEARDDAGPDDEYYPLWGCGSETLAAHDTCRACVFRLLKHPRIRALRHERGYRPENLRYNGPGAGRVLLFEYPDVPKAADRPDSDTVIPLGGRAVPNQIASDKRTVVKKRPAISGQKRTFAEQCAAIVNGQRKKAVPKV
jgi:hypothetical protein